MMVDKQVIGILLMGLVLYGSWTVFVVVTDRPIDFYTYEIAAYAFARGQNIYGASEAVYATLASQVGVPGWGGHGYVYPPFTALLAWPLTLLPVRLGAAIWVFSSGVASLSAAIFLGAFRQPLWKRRLILLASIAFVPTLAAMSLGQASVFVLFFTSASLYALRKGKPFLGGALLVMGVWIKPLTVSLICLLPWRKIWRAMYSSLLVSCGVLVSCLLAFGGSPLLSMFKVYALLPGMGMPPDPDPQTSLNLLGSLTRWLMRTQYGPPVANWDVAILPLYMTVSAAFIITMFFVLWPVRYSLEKIHLEASLLIVTTTLLSPITEINHFPLMFIGFAALIEEWRNWKGLELGRVAFVVSYSLIAAQTLILKYRLTGTPLLYDLSTAAEVILWIAIAKQLHGNLASSRNSRT